MWHCDSSGKKFVIFSEIFCVFFPQNFVFYFPENFVIFFPEKFVFPFRKVLFSFSGKFSYSCFTGLRKAANDLRDRNADLKRNNGE